jgi:hypothetical protein
MRVATRRRIGPSLFIEFRGRQKIGPSGVGCVFYSALRPQGGVKRFRHRSQFLVNSMVDKWFTPALAFELDTEVPNIEPCAVAEPESAL